VDKAAFAGYCQAYARWREAEEFLSKHGTIFKTPSGYIQQVPQVAIARNYLQIMKDFCSEFGLTPAARTRIRVDTESATSDDPMETLLRVRN
jgi:P27 family predicted phage terminase small subunit